MSDFDITGLEQYIQAELKSKRLLEGAADLIASIKTAKREEKDARAAADLAIADKAKAVAELAEANKKLKDAKEKPAAILAKAEAEAAKIIEGAEKAKEEMLAPAKKELASLNNSVTDAKTAFANYKKLAETAKADLDAIEKALAAQRAEAKRMAGV